MLVNREALAMPRRLIAAVEPLAPEHQEGNLNDRVVLEARDLALQCGATVHLAYSFEGIPPAALIEPSLPMGGMPGLYDALLEHARARFGEFCASLGVSADCRHLLHGPPAESLAVFAADAHADLLVVGTTRRGAFEHALFGSTAERIVHRAACDLLAVKPAGFAESFFRSVRFELPLAATVG